MSPYSATSRASQITAIRSQSHVYLINIDRRIGPWSANESYRWPKSDYTVGVHSLAQTFSVATHYGPDVCHREFPEMRSREKKMHTYHRTTLDRREYVYLLESLNQFFSWIKRHLENLFLYGTKIWSILESTVYETPSDMYSGWWQLLMWTFPETRGSDRYLHLHLTRYLYLGIWRAYYSILKSIYKSRAPNALNLDAAFQFCELCFEIWCGA